MASPKQHHMNPQFWMGTEVFPSQASFQKISTAGAQGSFALSWNGVVFQWDSGYWQAAHELGLVEALSAEYDGNLVFIQREGSNYHLCRINFLTAQTSVLHTGTEQFDRITVSGSQSTNNLNIWSLDNSGYVHHFNAGNWEIVPGQTTMRSISAYEYRDPKTQSVSLVLWAVGKDGYLYTNIYSDSGGRWSPGQWNKLSKPSNNLIQITAGNPNAIYAMDVSDTVYLYQLAGSTWTPIHNGKVADLAAAADGSLWALDFDKQEPYRRISHFGPYNITCEVEGKTYYLGNQMAIGTQMLDAPTWATYDQFKNFYKAWMFKVLDVNDLKQTDITSPILKIAINQHFYVPPLGAVASMRYYRMDPRMTFELSKKIEYAYFYLIITSATPGQTIEEILEGHSFQGLLIHQHCGMTFDYPAGEYKDPDSGTQQVIARIPAVGDNPVLTFTRSTT